MYKPITVHRESTRQFLKQYTYIVCIESAYTRIILYYIIKDKIQKRKICHEVNNKDSRMLNNLLIIK